MYATHRHDLPSNAAIPEPTPRVATLTPTPLRLTVAQLAAQAVGGTHVNLRDFRDALDGRLEPSGAWLAPLLRGQTPSRRRRLLERYVEAVRAADAARCRHPLGLAGLARRAIRARRPALVEGAVALIHHADHVLPMAFAAHLGASLADAPRAAEDALVAFATAFGRADALASDLRRLRRTDDAPGDLPYPVALSLTRLPPHAAARLAQSVFAGDLAAARADATVVDTARQTRALAHALADEAATHLAALPDSYARRQLAELARARVVVALLD